MGRLWYVLEVSDGDTAARFLPYDGFNIEDPTYKRWYLHNRTKAKSFRVLRLLPSYLFIRLPEFGVADWRRVNSTPGVVGPLGLGGIPEPLGLGVVEQLVFESRCGLYDERLAPDPAPKQQFATVLRSFDKLKDVLSEMMPSRETVAA